MIAYVKGLRNTKEEPRRWKKITARSWFRDGYTQYFSFTCLTLESGTVEELADYVEKDFRQWLEDSKKYGKDYIHGGEIKFKIISCDGVKVNRVIE